jgi:hypothetical protein
MGSDVITTLSNNRWILFENKIIASDLDVGSPHGMCEPAVSWAEVAGPSRSMLALVADTGRDRALQELFLTPSPSECTSPFLVLV